MLWSQPEKKAIVSGIEDKVEREKGSFDTCVCVRVNVCVCALACERVHLGVCVTYLVTLELILCP